MAVKKLVLLFASLMIFFSEDPTALMFPSIASTIQLCLI